jgi:hypothetical protein
VPTPSTPHPTRRFYLQFIIPLKKFTCYVYSKEAWQAE